MLKQKPGFKRFFTVMIALCMVICMSVPAMAKNNVCTRCQGAGQIEVLEKCGDCGGNGKTMHHCPYCGGSGIGGDVCPECNGSGQKDGDMCEECLGSGHSRGACSHCNSSGIMWSGECHECKGKGNVVKNITCPDCGGSGCME